MVDNYVLFLIKLILYFQKDITSFLFNFLIIKILLSFVELNSPKMYSSAQWIVDKL